MKFRLFIEIGAKDLELQVRVSSLFIDQFHNPRLESSDVSNFMDHR